MPKDIKQKIVLEGESEYKKALHDAARNLKTLKSELKAESAELGKNATEQQKAEAKTKNLTRQIAEQEKIVETCRAQLDEVRRTYGDNADAVAAYEQKLNAARATLGNMRSELAGLNDNYKAQKEEIQKAIVATNQFADSMDRISEAGSAVSEKIEGIFSGVVDKIGSMVAQIWAMVSEAAAEADAFSDLAGFWGTDAQTVQQYSRAVQGVHDSFSDLNDLVRKINMGGKEKDIATLLGISDVNYDNHWDYAMAVIGKLHSLQEEGKDLEPIYEKLFGEKKGEKAMDLVNDWALIQEKLKTFNGDEGGFGMTSDQMATMQQVQLEISKLEQMWDGLKQKIGAGLGETTLDLMVNAEGVLEGVNDFLNAGTSEEADAALEKIKTNVEEFCRKLGEAIRAGLGVLSEVSEELKESNDPLVQAIGDILGKLTSGLQWIVDNQEAVVRAFNAIFGIWLVAKVGAIGGKLLSIVASLKQIKNMNALNLINNLLNGKGGVPGPGTGVGGGAGGGGGTGGSPVATGTGAAAGVGKGVATKAFLAEGLKMAAAEAGVIAVALGPAIAQTVANQSEWREAQEDRLDRITETEKTLGKTVNTELARRGAAALGPQRDENGEIRRDATGLFYNMGGTGEAESILTGLQSRQGKQKAELYNMLHTYAPETAGYNTWGLLNRYWEQGDLDPVQVEALLESVTEAALKSEEAAAARAQQAAEEARQTVTAAAEDAGSAAASAVVTTVQKAEEEAADAAGSVTDAQRGALEALWDAWKRDDSERSDESSAALDAAQEAAEQAFLGQEDLYDKLDQWMWELQQQNPDSWTGMPDLPASYWQNAGFGSGEQITKTDISGFRSLPELIASAAKAGTASGVSGIRVTLDGYTVGELVAPYVGQALVRDFVS